MNLINKLTVNISIKYNKNPKAKSRTSQADPVAWDESESRKSRNTASKLSFNHAFLHNQNYKMSDLILATMAKMTKAEPPTQRVHKNMKKLENPNTTLRRKRKIEQNCTKTRLK